MDTVKTGAIIAEARKEKGLTQRQLAEALHVSDRTVSKWERGAGFPDVALLEPLADALGLSVTSLLRGEKVDGGGDEDVRYAVRTLRRSMAAKLKKNVLHIIYCLFAAVLIGMILWSIFEESGLLDRQIQLELTAGVYIDGERVEDTTVIIDGKYDPLRDSYSGRFAIECIEMTCRDHVRASIGWLDDRREGYVSIGYASSWGLDVVDVEYYMYMNKSMQSFALKMEDGTIIATSDRYAELMALEGYYPLVW